MIESICIHTPSSYTARVTSFTLRHYLRRPTIRRRRLSRRSLVLSTGGSCVRQRPMSSPGFPIERHS